MSPSDRSCDVIAHISEWFALTTTIRGGVLVRSMTMVGRINDYHGDDWTKDERFHGQGIKLFVSAPCKEDWISKVCQLEGLSHVCGAAIIEANMTPKTYDLDGEVVEDQPVQIHLSLSVEAFNAIQQQAYDAERRGHRLDMTATLSGNSLPEPRNSLGLLDLINLDVSERREFAVIAVRFQEVDRQ